MFAALIPGVISLVSKFIDKSVTNKDEANRLKAEFVGQAQELARTELESATRIIVAEAQGGSWLQRSWRPLTMLTFVGIVVAWWFGFTPDRATPELMESLFDLIKIGIGGYIAGRSAEKVAKAWKDQ